MPRSRGHHYRYQKRRQALNEILNLWGIVCRLFFKCNSLFIFKVGYLSLPEQLFVLSTFPIICQGQGQHENWTWNDLWNLSIIILLSRINTSIYNSLDWSGLGKRFLKKRFTHSLQGRHCHCPTRESEKHVKKCIETLEFPKVGFEW